MRAVAATLEERGVLDRRPGRTAHEIAAEAGAARPQAAPALAAAASTFDAVVYGDRGALAADYEKVVAADDAVAATRSRRSAVA
jgi:hypothetical protein